MTRIPVASSDVRSVGYDLDTGLMEVEFVKGMIYLYHDVPKSFYDDFMSAESKGRFVNFVIKRSGLAYERVG